jgi:hypothetical protein
MQAGYHGGRRGGRGPFGSVFLPGGACRVDRDGDGGECPRLRQCPPTAAGGQQHRYCLRSVRRIRGEHRAQHDRSGDCPAPGVASEEEGRRIAPASAGVLSRRGVPVAFDAAAIRRDGEGDCHASRGCGVRRCRQRTRRRLLRGPHGGPPRAAWPSREDHGRSRHGGGRHCVPRGVCAPRRQDHGVPRGRGRDRDAALQPVCFGRWASAQVTYAITYAVILVLEGGVLWIKPKFLPPSSPPSQ